MVTALDGRDYVLDCVNSLRSMLVGPMRSQRQHPLAQAPDREPIQQGTDFILTVSRIPQEHVERREHSRAFGLIEESVVDLDSKVSQTAVHARRMVGVLADLAGLPVDVGDASRQAGVLEAAPIARRDRQGLDFGEASGDQGCVHSTASLSAKLAITASTASNTRSEGKT
ncbi:MAG: hypothetical protein ACRDLD_02315 [Thermoleophilaceae bacterium]